MSRIDLVTAMAASSGWTKVGADRALRAFLESVRTSLKRGQPVTPMPLLLAWEALDAGRAQWEARVLVSQRAALTPRYRMGLKKGESAPLRTLPEGVAIASANDAAPAVAEHLGGTEEAFVAAMNAKAEELGLTRTHFANAHGLPDPAQRSTAEDLARLTQRLLDDYTSSR